MVDPKKANHGLGSSDGPGRPRTQLERHDKVCTPIPHTKTLIMVVIVVMIVMMSLMSLLVVCCPEFPIGGSSRLWRRNDTVRGIGSSQRLCRRSCCCICHLDHVVFILRMQQWDRARMISMEQQLLTRIIIIIRLIVSARAMPHPHECVPSKQLGTSPCCLDLVRWSSFPSWK